MNIESIEQRKEVLKTQMSDARKKLDDLQRQSNQTQALVNAIEGALLDCDYWQDQLNGQDKPEATYNGIESTDSKAVGKVSGKG